MTMTMTRMIMRMRRMMRMMLMKGKPGGHYSQLRPAASEALPSHIHLLC